MNDTVEILKININNISYKSAVSAISKQSIKRKSGFVCFANAHMAVEALNNVELEKSLKKSQMIFADGFPIAKSMKLIYSLDQERIAGMDFFAEMLKICDKLQLRIYLFGSTEEVIKRAMENISKEFPNLVIAGSISPPFGENWTNDEYIRIINKSKPNLVFVSLGCPKQEIWMAKHYQKIYAPLLGIGGALPVSAGIFKRAPLLIRRLGFEWLFRLFQEPRRLFKRYLYTNTMFVYHVLKEWWSKQL